MNDTQNTALQGLTDTAEALKAELAADAGTYTPTLTIAFKAHTDDGGRFDAYRQEYHQKYEQIILEQIFIDMVSKKDEDTILRFLEDGHIALDMNLKIDYTYIINHVFDNDFSSDFLMNILNYIPDDKKVALRAMRILSPILENKRVDLIEHIIDLPDDLCRPILQQLSQNLTQSCLEEEPYSRLLDRASSLNITCQTDTETLLVILNDKQTDKRFDYFSKHSERINYPIFPYSDCKPILKPLSDARKMPLITYLALSGNWDYAREILENTSFDRKQLSNKNIKTHKFNPLTSDRICINFSSAIKRIAKHNRLPDEAYDFIDAVERKLGLNKTIIPRKAKRVSANYAGPA